MHVSVQPQRLNPALLGGSVADAGGVGVGPTEGSLYLRRHASIGGEWRYIRETVAASSAASASRTRATASRSVGTISSTSLAVR